MILTTAKVVRHEEPERRYLQIMRHQIDCFPAVALWMLALTARALWGASATIKVEEGDKYCTVLSLQNSWTVRDPRSPQHIDFFGYAYEFRWSGTARNEVLFSIDRAASFRDLGQLPVYRIALAPPARITLANEADWKKAVKAPLVPAHGEMTYKLLSGKEPPENGYPTITSDSRVFDYEGRLFPKSGDIWHVSRPVLFSWEKTYAALQSWNGWLAGKTSGDGPFFVDIFQTRTGSRAALLRGQRRAITPEFVFLYTGWLTDRDFLVPFPFHDYPEIVVCHFDR
jgi:hypothetical protein